MVVSGSAFGERVEGMMLARLCLAAAACGFVLSFTSSSLRAQMMLDSARSVATPPAGANPSAKPGDPLKPGDPNAKPRAKPVAVAMPKDEALLGRTLLQNGQAGTMKLEKTKDAVSLRISMPGTKTDSSGEACRIDFAGEALVLGNAGRPRGLQRYKAEGICPIEIEILDGAALVVGPSQPCVVEAQQCRADPRGLWGPDWRSLIAQSKDIEKARITAESAVQSRWKDVMTRSGAGEKRSLAAEQAGFTSRRAELCRDFVNEEKHGFCALKITEARAATLASQ
jgi:hypothetical protein